ncbi:mediator of DNA damage checkpoint protein 1 isoform X8 [Osmia bicornis bicornis]|uniref:mediator of DNA damage checkpoint protein 1 isoform X8 n=1 Tax=Osmia bicornis bicornis TaxID=1437191 RepID=UPI001EAED507|nr:mediator of DNA damage checkpoint protein 1 isoform X8 [Osmia bicornis bicornis]
MPANKGNLSTPHKEKAGNGLTSGASKKKKRCTVKHKKHCKQYLQLHSEYRSTYTWHEYTGPHQEHTVVRRAPQPPPTSTKQPSAKLQSAKSTEDENNEGPTLEPPLPRRKKCPELAYKTHEFITAADGGGVDAVDSNVVADKVREVTAQSGLPPSQLSKAISRISTEYRLQFAWPRRPQLMNGETVAPGVPAAGIPAGTTGPPRKSLSMGALKQGIAPTGPAPVHKKRPGDVDHKRDGMQASELEPLVGGTGTDTIDGAVPEGDEREEDVSDLKITFRSVTKEEKEKENTRKVAPITTTMTMPPAGQPSCEQTRPIHGILQDDSKTDIERVSSLARARKDFLIRHHLDRTTGVGDGALLPSPTREKLEPVIPRRREDAKEHREEIQPKTKSSPKNSPRTGRSQSLGPTVTERRSPKRQPPRAPSVTKEAKEKEKEREPKDKEKEHREKSGEPERHPRPRVVAGVSVTGPGHVRWSIREPSAVSSTGSSSSVPPLPPPPSGPGPTPFYRRSPQVHRKSFLATTAPPHRPLHHAKPSTTSTSTITTTTSTTVKPSVKHSVHTSVHHPPASSAAAAARPDRVKDISRCQQGPHEAQAKTNRDQPAAAAAAAAAADRSKSSSDSRYASNQANQANAVQPMTAEPQINGDVTGGESSVASTPPSQTQPPAMSATAVSPWIDDEPVVKSPPEPTRVKSPEQMIMRSPEPVNWTVPLDTGKTFTVTQNVREEPLTRPHSEAKTWAPSSAPSAPQSAPPELAAQHKSQHSQHSGYKSPESESVSLGSFTGLNGHKDMDSERDSPLPTNVQSASTPVQAEKEAGSVEEESKDQQRSEPSIKPVAGTNLRCLEDPGFEYDRKKDVGAQPTTTATMTTPSSSTPQPGYRILEAESPQAAGTTGGYHVLEAPTVVPGSAQRSAASEVLEKARNRFDKFWGKGSGSEN